MRSVRGSLLGLAAVLAGLGCAPEPVATTRASLLDEGALDGWASPNATIPSDDELLDQLAEAIELRERRELDRLLDAREPGELFEHAMLDQNALDSGAFGPAAMFVVGDDLFELLFRPENGLGNGLDGPPPHLRRVHLGEIGGPDALACASCHSLGGLDGAGSNTQNAFFRGDGDLTSSADVRNPPALLGLGPIEALAREMSRDLADQREALIADATTRGEARTVALETHGVSFGELRADATGRLDTRGVVGVDPDLIVRAFGWKGHQPTIRAIAAEAFRVHLGIVSVADQVRVARGELDPAIYGDGGEFDADRDGVSVEIEDGMLSTMSAYLAQLEVPIVAPPDDELALSRFARGGALFGELGCASCHRPSLELADPILPITPDHPDLADRPPILIDVAHDGDQPKIEQRVVFGSTYGVDLFSDLRRHDMGPELATPGYVSTPGGTVAPSVFLTRPLWGLAVSAPYLHDGRAPTVEDAILAHGGEGAASRDAFRAASDDDRAALRTFLMSLTRRPRLGIP